MLLIDSSSKSRLEPRWRFLLLLRPVAAQVLVEGEESV